MTVLKAELKEKALEKHTWVMKTDNVKVTQQNEERVIVERVHQWIPQVD